MEGSKLVPSSCLCVTINDVWFILILGDEILAVNGQVCHDISHAEAVQLFKNIKSGPVALHVCRRVKSKTG